MIIDREAMEAFLTWREFKELPEYSTTIPTGKTIGKVWKAHRGGEWWLREYVELPEDDPKRNTEIGINTYTLSIIKREEIAA
jgi:hypothetical protein